MRDNRPVLSPETIVAPPPPDPVVDPNESTSFFAGIGECIWDELKALWDLAKFLYELAEDLDVAADGYDNWGNSPISDSVATWAHFNALEDGRRVLGDYSNTHIAALQRVYAKVTLVRKTLEEIMEAGIGFLAAYDVYIDNTNKR